jgi:hypothetical protein
MEWCDDSAATIVQPLHQYCGVAAMLRDVR